MTEYSSEDYFVCTLGQASVLAKEGRGHPFLSLNHLLDVQAKNNSDLPILGITVPAEGSWRCTVLTFRDILYASMAVAHYYEDNKLLPSRKMDDGTREMTVALLCSSSLDFAITLFAAMRMGLAALLIAPQCTPVAVAHLCNSTNVTHLIHHSSYTNLATEAQALMSEVVLVPLAPTDTWTFSSKPVPLPYPTILTPQAESSTCCFIYHSSGTSSGLPKPLPQTHHTMTVLHPRLPGARAALSTTPLYHGGLADLVRALTSRVMLWLFPSADAPLTKANIMKTIETCSQYAEQETDAQKKRHLRIGHLSCVPYILEMLVGDELAAQPASGPSLDFLRGLDMLGVGGAPLSNLLGDALVDKGIRLVSRYGSAECGFLMSSVREFANDKHWNYLRSHGNGGWLEFEKQDESDVGDVVAELVVKNGWPCMTKTNRPDGSFATGDLYIKHPVIPDAWKYLGRKDDLLVLVNGKKADPVPLEATLRSHPSFSDVLIFGVGRPVLGALVVPKLGISARHAEDAAWMMIKEANDNAPSHMRIPTEMIIVLPENTVFPRTSKGTVQRPVAYKTHEDTIARAYESFERGGAGIQKRIIQDVGEMVTYLLDVINAIVEPDSTSCHGARANLTPDTDLFNYGVDSVQALRIRNRLQAELDLEDQGDKLGANAVYEHPSAAKLARRLASLVGIGAPDEDFGSEDELEVMLRMVEKYGTWESDRTVAHAAHSDSHAGAVLLLTGASGALGAHLLSQALSRTDGSISEVVCLVRAKDDASAHQRVCSSLSQRKLPDLHQRSTKIRVTTLAAKFDEVKFGLRVDTYNALANRTTIIIHAAWAVNFIGTLQSFEADHIRGVHDLISFALKRPSNPASFFFCSSGATVLGKPPAVPIPERVPESPASAAPIGYARSKWVAEHICARAWAGPMHKRIGVLRVGQLCGDTQNGVWNESEGWPLMLRTMDEVGCLPDLDEEVVWLPVNVAASAILDIAFAGSAKAACFTNEDVPVYHIMSTSSTPWSKILHWAQEMKDFGIVSPQEWIRAMQDSKTDMKKNPSRKLLAIWEKRYNQAIRPPQEPGFVTSVSTTISSALRYAEPITMELVTKILDHWIATGYLQSQSSD